MKREGNIFQSQANKSGIQSRYAADSHSQNVPNANVSRRAFENATNSERRLLKAGHREIVSPLMVKRRLRPKIELHSRSSLHKLQNSNDKNRPKKNSADRLRNLHAAPFSRFNISGIVENKVMSDVSKQLVKHADTKLSKVLCGLPTCLAFNSKFIAVGTQLGIILIFDLFEVLRQRLGASNHDENWTNGKVSGSISSVDLSHNGEAIVSGYTSGAIVLWDTIRGVVLRAINESHMSPITTVRFLGDLKMVTVDAGGLVNKLSFTKNILWTNYSMEQECLLDGTAGQILAMNVLSPFSTIKPAMRPTALTKIFSKLTLMALSSERSSFVVAVDPKVNVLHRWAKPPSERTNQMEGFDLVEPTRIFLPCLSWGWALISGGGNVVIPTLARAWGCCLQLLCASFPTLDEGDPPVNGMEPIVHWPAFGMREEVDAGAPVVAIDWLNERTLVFLTESNELTLVDTVMMTLTERLDFSGVNLVFAEFSLSRSVKREDAISDAASTCMVFQNSTRCSDDRLLVLCQDTLLCISIVSARRRISALEADGEWLEALAFALDHYENTVTSQEDRRRDPNGRKDLSRHPEFSAAKSDEEEWIAKLLMRYLNLAVENAPETVELRKQTSQDVGQRVDLAQSHYQMLCGVACEFCLSTRRLDLLFGPIFRKFQSVGYSKVFLDVLEPYVLNDKLKYIAPEVMALFVEHCKSSNGLDTVERCLLHMDCTIIDFDSILVLLRRHDMFTALFYVFNQGLDDYVSPLEILLEKVFDEADAGGIFAVRNQDGALITSFESLGYKSIVYLQACFHGKSFPSDANIEPEDRQRSLKHEMLQFLAQNIYSPSSQVSKGPITGHRSFPYPYIRLLLSVDPWCTFNFLTVGLDASNDTTYFNAGSRSVEQVNDGSAAKAGVGELANWIQTFIDLLTSIIFPNHSSKGISDQSFPQSPYIADAFLEFTSNYLMRGAVAVDKETTFLILKRKSDQYASVQHSNDRWVVQNQIMTLLSALPCESYNPDRVLQVFDSSKMHRASLLLHQQVASSWHCADSVDDTERRAYHFSSAIDCYLGDEDLTFRKEVFFYVKKECSGITENNFLPSERKPKSLRDVLLLKLSDLVHLDAVLTSKLVIDLFADEFDQVMLALDSKDGGLGQFLLLQALISGNELIDSSSEPALILSTEHRQRYLALMAKMYPEMVYKYLSSNDNYSNEESLRLCQQYEIADASAYLLERMGNVSSAIQLILQTLESRLMALKRTIRGLGVDSFRRQAGNRFEHGHVYAFASSDTSVQSKQDRDIEAVTRILVVALDICERNSVTFEKNGSDDQKFPRGELWFNVLDRLINAKGFLRLAKEQTEHAKIMENVLSDLLRRTMQRMVSSVPLADLVRKVTSDHSGSKIGELRELVENLLETYGIELQVFLGAASAFHNDIREMQRRQFAHRVQGTSVRAVMNSPARLFDSTSHFLGTEGFLDVSTNGSTTFVPSGPSLFRGHNEIGLADAMARLQVRRESNGSNVDNSDRFRSLNMMTSTELIHQENEEKHVIFDRFCGVLGDAEHRGRLMMFH